MWTARNIPDLAGKTAVITGSNSGIGYEAALQLAGKGARVILACRDAERTRAAAVRIKETFANATVDTMHLDLASLASIRAFAAAFAEKYSALNILCNNAGVMALPYRKTVDGFEMQFGTNHLGHFALTGLLLERIVATPAARVVTVSSGVHRAGAINFDDLSSEKSYGKWRAYAQSKIANLMFTYELQRRLQASKADAIAVACHPGYAATNLQAAGPRMEGSSLMESITDIGNRLLAQSAAMGALPTLYAATAPEVRGGDYIGPDGLFENWGHPKKTTSNARSHDMSTAARLWDVSEELTSVHYEAISSGG